MGDTRAVPETSSAFEANRDWWDERVSLHVASDFYDVEGFRRGRSTLEPFEADEMPQVSGRSLLHLQCHFGMDTLSWARLGARVTGLDFSSAAIAAARDLADSVGIEATFVHGSVDQSPTLLGEPFDIVYTGKGALNWLPELDAWARTVSTLLRPGGLLYLVEFHPFSDVFSYKEFAVEYPYFRHGQPDVDRDRTGSYADLAAKTVHNHTVQWPHTMGEIVSAASRHHLRVEFLHEFPYTLYPRWPWLEVDAEGAYRLPSDLPTLPLLFSMRAVRA
jgi:SAM-dependent methyltransferase